jgi:hypothetical protein
LLKMSPDEDLDASAAAPAAASAAAQAVAAAATAAATAVVDVASSGTGFPPWWASATAFDTAVRARHARGVGKAARAPLVARAPAAVLCCQRAGGGGAAAGHCGRGVPRRGGRR